MFRVVRTDGGARDPQTFPHRKEIAERQLAELREDWPNATFEIEEVLPEMPREVVETEDALDREIRLAKRRKQYARRHRP